MDNSIVLENLGETTPNQHTQQEDPEVLQENSADLQESSTKEKCQSDTDNSADTESTESSDDSDKSEPDGGVVLTSHCGIGPWHPKWLQVFATAKFFTFLICVYALVEGAIVSGFTSVVLSSIEKRYRFSSTAASMIVAVFDISVTICAVFISYFGHTGHKPRWMGIGLIIQGFGALVFALPQFIFGRYQIGSDAKLQLESCDDGTSAIPSCDPANNIAYAMFIIGNILIGAGAAPIFTIGLSFIDDIVYPKYVSIHLGLFHASVVIGPAIGYGLGGAFLSIFVDPSETTILEEDDPGWVGAWWLCFIVGAFFSFLAAIPFMMYPRVLYNTHKVTEARKKEMADKYISKYGDEKEILTQVKSFPAHMKQLLLNPSYMLVTFAISFLFLSLEGMVSFGPKYVESVFSVPASFASIIIGLIAIPSGGLGVIVGALLVYFTKAKGKKLPIISWVICFITLLPAFGFFIYCPNLNIAGIHADYSNSSFSSSSDVLLSSCNYDCNCTSTVFEPVCGADGITYFSACRAGCQKSLVNNDPQNPMFENCTCVFNDDGVTDSFSGKCDQNCNLLGIWALFLAVFVFLLFVLKVPTVLTTLRAVAEEQRTLALGFQSVLYRVFGTIPGPIIFGVIFDSGCVYWQFECNRRGNCWVYNNNILGVRAFAIAFAGILVSAILLILCWIFYPPVSKFLSVLNCNGKEEKPEVNGKSNGDIVLNKNFENPVSENSEGTDSSTKLENVAVDSKSGKVSV